ncbi:MAG: 4,5-DOPA dioxygenase extradiol, partial [Candidatus Eremiobacteraeota bacterium]|nr:4,5-DOPA dioxygenase extradiol [Candidatus Eremiobacteraeota bacterium]
LSIDERQPTQFHYDLAKRLTPLRDEDVMIVGSGNVVHNLHEYAWGEQAEQRDWAARFEARTKELLLARDHAPLIAYQSLGRDALLSIPTPEHYLPLLYVVAQQCDGDAVTFPIDGIEGGSLSMLSVVVGG